MVHTYIPGLKLVLQLLLWWIRCRQCGLHDLWRFVSWLSTPYLGWLCRYMYMYIHVHTCTCTTNVAGVYYMYMHPVTRYVFVSLVHSNLQWSYFKLFSKFPSARHEFICNLLRPRCSYGNRLDISFLRVHNRKCTFAWLIALLGQLFCLFTSQLTNVTILMQCRRCRLISSFMKLKELNRSFRI